MTRALALLTFSLLASPAFPHSTPPPPAFAPAAVHATAAPRPPSAKGPSVRNGRYEIQTATMVDLVRIAYDVEADKVLDGPSWLELDRFDVLAKLPPHSTRD